MSSSSSSSPSNPHTELPWIPPPPETNGNRFWRKAKENPLVPIGRLNSIFRYLFNYLFITGCLATVGALSMGLVSFKRGNMAMSQNMMRLRVVAQGGTVVGLVGGIALASTKQN